MDGHDYAPSVALVYEDQVATRPVVLDESMLFKRWTSLREVNEGGLGTGWFRRRTDVDASGEVLVIGGDGFAVFLETCQIALDGIDRHPPRLAQRTAPRNTSGKCGNEYSVSALGLRPENNLVAHGPMVREDGTSFKRYASL